ncbi:hypothetical protein Cni_G07986 [Canna indica]|uniref:Dof-type domain-containing protein n=1 Tax=Canna indica TaxID=4628 RepID=A0AAQ3JZH9_9LILI|nr:hypothetical protein Cni_G07986 [Canna indica]
MTEVEQSPSFKLFGAVIVKEDRRGRNKEEEEEEAPQTEYSTPAPADQAEEVAATTARAGLPCPRCKSKETKFCYFNNYNVNQPRHFCKACHRYWTAGGSLRNVPARASHRRHGRPARRPAPRRTTSTERPRALEVGSGES